MSDAELRELERRWRESGSDADEAAWLEARVRAGDLAEGRLQLAACLEHPAACLLREAGSKQRPFDAQPRFQKWAQQLPLWDRRVVRVRLGVAFPARVGGLEAPYDACLAAVEGWICCPCRRHEEELSDRRADCDRASLGSGTFSLTGAPPPEDAPEEGPAERLAATAVLLAGAVLAAEERAKRDAFKAIDRAIAARFGWWEPEEAKRLVEAQRLDVVPWLLGTGDPLRMRVAKTGETDIWLEDPER